MLLSNINVCLQDGERMKQRWTDKEVIERIKASIKIHWSHIEMELKNEPDWKGTWNDFRTNWLNWNVVIHEYYYHISQLQQILDILDKEVDEIIRRKNDQLPTMQH